MPSALTYPGVYIEEIPSGVRTIVGVSTSVTAFVGRATKGPTDGDEDAPVIINSFADYERTFGGLSPESAMSFAVRDFFLNGGSQAAIVRIVGAARDASGQLPAELSGQVGIAPLTLRAANPGKWAKDLRITVDGDVSAEAAKTLGFFKASETGPVGDPAKLFNLFVSDASSGAREVFLNLTLEAKNDRQEDTNQRIDRVLSQGSKLVRWNGAAPAPGTAFPALKTAREKKAALDEALAANPADPAAIKAAREAYDAALLPLADPLSVKESALRGAQEKGDDAAIKAAERDLAKAVSDAAAAIKDEEPLTEAMITGEGTQGGKRGLYALERADLFNLLSIPPYKPDPAGLSVDPGVIAKAAAYCEARRAFFIVDPPASWTDKARALRGIQEFATTSKNAAIFFPHIRVANPFHDNRLEPFAPSGALAGVFARTDTTRGVWKAPAGLDASLVGVPELALKLTDAENGELNQKAVNCLRAFPSAGRVVWGSRTLRGADSLASEWKYIPVRRTALYIEESLYRGTQWVVFEPNDEPLWAQIRLNIGAFMHDLFRQGAFQGQTPREAYLVKCDKDTTTQSDINRGVVNIVVGFAPLKPAEFVVIKLQQLAGQIET